MTSCIQLPFKTDFPDNTQNVSWSLQKASRHYDCSSFSHFCEDDSIAVLEEVMATFTCRRLTPATLPLLEQLSTWDLENCSLMAHQAAGHETHCVVDLKIEVVGGFDFPGPA